MIRYLLAVAAGFVLWTLLFLGGNALMTAIAPGAFNEDGSTESAFLFFAILCLTVAYSVVSGNVTARIAQKHRVRCGILLGLLLLVVGIAVRIQFWDILPIWYNLAFLALLIPGAAAGASISTS